MSGLSSLNGNKQGFRNKRIRSQPNRVRAISPPPAFPLQLAVLQEERRWNMQCDDFLEEDGIRLGYNADTVTITEIGYGRKAVLDNEGNVISSTFPKDSLDFVHRYFRQNYKMIERARSIDRKYGHD
ncbi:hypothetical protein OZX67_01120 [Bifidobacterium sp. ESL0728]|uniref:hypothetical protein n=1 Tax=Bifidobacterium sp. ESL0728 TaxID=2983220 RepID=UPI0023F8CF23|nr:hypothetical protein [Bifidobacterium sp. ESL0728]WEV59203.1 hypothetical protein OZX67_01120 [Bifidobacterium sp. ESL0728]